MSGADQRGRDEKDEEEEQEEDIFAPRRWYASAARSLPWPADKTVGTSRASQGKDKGAGKRATASAKTPLKGVGTSGYVLCLFLSILPEDAGRLSYTQTRSWRGRGFMPLAGEERLQGRR